MPAVSAFLFSEMQDLESFKALIERPAKVAIVTHQNPDADALGSSLGLSLYLQKKGHEVTVISPTDYPNFLNWMKGQEEVLIYESPQQDTARRALDEADIIFCLDFSSLDRINNMGGLVGASSAKKVLIDHHLDPSDFADFTEWSDEAAATAELVYGLLVQLGDKHLIDEDIANCLFAGVMTDTGSFRHPNTTKNVFQVAAELTELGANSAKVAKLIYDTNSVERLRFLGFALSERLTVLPEFHTAYLAISQEDLKKFNSKTGDTEGLVNYALSIEGISLAAIIIDRGSIIKLSFRSIGEFSVNQFALDNFEGGGHRNAAGGKSTMSLTETVKKFVDLLPNYREELNVQTKTVGINE